MIEMGDLMHYVNSWFIVFGQERARPGPILEIDCFPVAFLILLVLEKECVKGLP